MRILVISPGFWKDSSIRPTGALLQTYYVAKFLSENGWHVDFLTLTRDSAKHGRVEEHGNLHVHYLKEHRISLVNLLPVLRYGLSMDFCYVYQRGRSWMTFSGALLSRIKGANFIWASSAQEGLEKWKYTLRVLKTPLPLWRKAFKIIPALIEDLLLQLGIRMANVILVQNEFQKEMAYKIWKRQAIIIQNMQMPVSIYPDKSDKPVAIWVGTLTQWKRPDIFVEIARQIKEIQFIMVGGGDKSTLNELELPENLKYLGPLPHEEVLKLMEKAWFIVNTSEKNKEGIPNVVIEAAMRGTVPISLNEDYGFLPEELVVKDVKDVVQIIRKYTGNKASFEEMSRRLFEMTGSMFSYNEVGNKLLKVLDGSPCSK